MKGTSHMSRVEYFISVGRVEFQIELLLGSSLDCQLRFVDGPVLGNCRPPGDSQSACPSVL